MASLAEMAEKSPQELYQTSPEPFQQQAQSESETTELPMPATTDTVSDYQKQWQDTINARDYIYIPTTGSVYGKTTKAFQNIATFPKEMQEQIIRQSDNQLTRQSYGERTAKQAYNQLIANPIHELGKSDAIGDKAFEIQQFRQKQREAEGRAFSHDELNQEYEQLKKYLKVSPEMRPASEYLNDPLATAKQYTDINELAAKVDTPDGVADYLTDIGIGLGAFIIQVAALRKTMPTAPESVLWEQVNLASGGQPGAGAAMFGTMKLAGAAGTKYVTEKLLARGVGKTAAKVAGETTGSTATGIAFAAPVAASGGDVTDILTNFGLPFVFQMAGMIKAGKTREAVATIRNADTENKLFNYPDADIEAAVGRVLAQKERAAAQAAAQKNYDAKMSQQSYYPTEGEIYQEQPAKKTARDIVNADRQRREFENQQKIAEQEARDATEYESLEPPGATAKPEIRQIPETAQNAPQSTNSPEKVQTIQPGVVRSSEAANKAITGAGKPVWQMTKQEYIDFNNNALRQIGSKEKITGEDHKDKIKFAIEEGKPVPPEVLKDYPDLQKQADFNPPAPEVGRVKSTEAISQKTAKDIITKKGMRSGTIVVPEFIQKAAEKAGITPLEPVEQVEYTKTEIPKKTMNDVVREKATKYGSDIARQYNERLRPISSRLYQIAKPLWRMVRQHQFDIDKAVMAEKQQVYDWAKKVSRIRGDDALQLKNALINGKDDVSNAIFKKYGLSDLTDKVNRLMSQKRQEYIESGGDIGEIESYFHRYITDPQGLSKQIDSYINDRIESSIRGIERKRNRALEPAEKDKIYNLLLQDFNTKHLSFTPGAARQRELKIVPPELLKFYADPVRSLMNYIETMNQKIAMRKFFGKEGKQIVSLRKELSSMLTQQAKLKSDSPEYKQIQKKIDLYRDYLARAADVDLQDSIGAKVNKYHQEGKISAEDVGQVKDMLKSYFAPGHISATGELGRAVVHADILNGLLNALTQFQTEAINIHEIGAARYAKTLAKAFARTAATGFRKSGYTIKLKDLGIHDIGEEFSSSKFRKVSKPLLFALQKADKVNKFNLVNGLFESYQKQARNLNANPKFKKYLLDIYEKPEEVARVVSQFARGEWTPDTQFVVYSKTLDIHPIGQSEMPQKYLEAKNGKLVYLLKTYTIKQFDYLLNESVRKMANKETRREGIVNAIKLPALLVAFGAGTDAIKDWLKGKKIDLPDSVLSGILQLVPGFNRYNVDLLAKGDYAGFVGSQVALPKTVVNLARDIKKGKISQLKKSIPYVGDIIYKKEPAGKKQKRTARSIRKTREGRE